MQTKLFNNEAEQNLIACMVLHPNTDMLENIFSTIQPSDFFVNEYRTIYVAVQTLFNGGKAIDMVTVNETIERIKNKKDKTNYIGLLLEITNSLADALHWDSYLKIVYEYAQLRKIEAITKQTTENITNLRNSADVLQSLSKSLDQLELEHQKGRIEKIGEVTKTELELINKKINGEVDDFGLATGFPVLDKLLWGLQSGELVVVGARAGVGKTAWALNVLDYVANNLQKNCLFFSLEMPASQIAQRLLCIGSGISNTELREPKQLTDTKRKLLQQAEHRLSSGKLYIDDTTDNTVQAMTVKARQMKRTQGLELIVVDYLQFVRPAKKSGNRYLDVGDIARELKVMARQLQVPVIALCQLNRALDTDDRMPTMADLRESGEIENNADIIMFLHSKSDRFSAVKDIDLIIGKFRRGAMRAVRMQYTGEVYKFKELDKNESTQPRQIELTPLADDEELPF